jgi:hypothetical protein
VRDARALGVPEAAIAALEAGGDAGDLEVWPENWATLDAFLAVSTQWRVVPGVMGGAAYYAGLDYAGVAAGLAGAGIAATPELWAGLRTMEAAARDALNGVRG